MQGTMEWSGHSAQLREAFRALSSGQFRLGFQTQYFLTGPLAAEEWARLIAQHRDVHGDAAVPASPGIAAHVLPERWNRAA